VNLLRVKTFPLQLLSDGGATSQEFVDHLRETLLQDPSELVEEVDLVAEIAIRICYELANGTPSPWHFQGYKTLWAIYLTPIGKRCLQDLVRTGDLVQKLAKRAFKTAVQGATEHARAIDFFVMLAHDAPEFRTYLLSPSGVLLLIQNIKGLATANPPTPMFDLCGGLANLSSYSWCLLYVPLDVCQPLVNLLITNDSNSHLGNPLERIWSCELIILFLYNLSLSSAEGRQAIQTASSNELRGVLPIIEASLRQQRGQRAADRTRARIKKTWPEYCGSPE